MSAAPVGDDVRPNRSLVDLTLRVGLPVATTAILLLLAVTRATRQPVNADTYFHIRLGREFISGWVPWDPGTVTSYATRDWLPTQWLSQVAIGYADDWFGLRGVVALSAVAMIFYAVVLVRTGRQESSLLVASSLTALAVFASLNGLSARPQVLSYALGAITVAAWLRTDRDGRIRWWLIGLIWLWAMLHGMWPVGISICAAGALGHVLDGGPAWRTRLRVLLLPVGAALAAALTPAGPGLYSAVLTVGSRASYFNEWGPPDFTTSTTAVMGLMLAATVALRLRGPRDTWTADLILLGVAAWALYSGRTTPVCAAMLTSLLARQLERRLRTATPARRPESAALVGAGALTVVVAVLAAWLGPDPVPPSPPRLDDALAELPAGTPVFSDLQFGGYLLWKYPQLDVVAHGYADMYTDAEFDDVVDVLGVEPGWDEILAEGGVDYAVVLDDSAIGYALEQRDDWESVVSTDGIRLMHAVGSSLAP